MIVEWPGILVIVEGIELAFDSLSEKVGDIVFCRSFFFRPLISTFVITDGIVWSPILFRRIGLEPIDSTGQKVQWEYWGIANWKKKKTSLLSYFTPSFFLHLFYFIRGLKACFIMKLDKRDRYGEEEIIVLRDDKFAKNITYLELLYTEIYDCQITSSR